MVSHKICFYATKLAEFIQTNNKLNVYKKLHLFKANHSKQPTLVRRVQPA